MIQFFRKIRQNLISEGKTGRYLKYAIGEIVLVMIGILLALQVNNWNENRKAKIREKELLVNLTVNLYIDKTRFTYNLKEADEILNVYKQLYQIGTNGESDLIIDNPNYVRKIVMFDSNMNQDFSALSEKITNDDIRNHLLLYDSELNKFETEFSEFRVVIERVRVFLGDKGIYKIETLYNTDDFSDAVFVDVYKLKDLSRTIEFQQLMFEAKLKLELLKKRLQKVIMHNKEFSETIDKNIVLY